MFRFKCPKCNLFKTELFMNTRSGNPSPHNHHSIPWVGGGGGGGFNHRCINLSWGAPCTPPGRSPFFLFSGLNHARRVTIEVGEGRRVQSIRTGGTMHRRRPPPVITLLVGRSWQGEPLCAEWPDVMGRVGPTSGTVQGDTTLPGTTLTRGLE